MAAVTVYVTVPPGTASHVNSPVAPTGVAAVQLVVTASPGNKIEVLPAGFGKLFVSVTVKLVPSLTISVGPGSCTEGQNPIEANAAGEYVAEPVLQP
jgi:hypothetical protein